MSRKIDTDSWEYKFMLIKRTRPKDFSKKMRMNWGMRRRMVDYAGKLNTFVSTFGGCTPTDVISEANRADMRARVALGRLNGLVEGMRLSGIEVVMELYTVIDGLPLQRITVLEDKE